MQTIALIAVTTAACVGPSDDSFEPHLSPPPESVHQALERFVPETPAIACGGFTWRRHEVDGMIKWVLEEKAGRKRAAMQVLLTDATGHLDELAAPTTMFAGFPAIHKAGRYLEVQVGNVIVAAWTYHQTFPAFANDGVLETMVTGLHLPALAKL